MTLYRFPVFRALPPTADFWAKYVGTDDAEAYPTIGLALHFLYGGFAGGLFGVVISRLDFRNKRERNLGILGLSLVYGLALSAFGTRILFRYLLDEELEPDEAVIGPVSRRRPLRGITRCVRNSPGPLQTLF